jgi:hypothetical protein
MADTGIRRRHGRACDGAGRCKCPWEASVYSKRDGKKIRQQFPTRVAAIEWRDKSRPAVRERRMRAPTQVTVTQAANRLARGRRCGVPLPLRVVAESRRDHPWRLSQCRGPIASELGANRADGAGCPRAPAQGADPSQLEPKR